MQKFVHGLAAAIAVAALWQPVSASAATTVLSFDDIAEDGMVPLNYGGLDWSSAGWTVFNTPAAPYTPHSGTGRIATGFMAEDAASTIRFNQQVTLDGAWFAGLGGAVLSIDMYANGALVHSSAALDPSATPAFLASGYTGLIDTMVVHSANHGEFVMDDLRFQVAAPVPEPESYALLLVGLATVAGILRARRRAASSTTSA